MSHVSLLAFFFFAGLGAWFSSGFSVEGKKQKERERERERDITHMTLNMWFSASLSSLQVFTTAEHVRRGQHILLADLMITMLM